MNKHRGIAIVGLVIAVLVLCMFAFSDPDPVPDGIIGFDGLVALGVPVDTLSVTQEVKEEDVPYYLESFWECHKLCSRITRTFRGTVKESVVCREGCANMLLRCK